jgi:hypothetical protein
MASQNQLEMGSLAVIPKLQNPSNNNVEDEDDFTGRCRIRAPMVSMLTSLPCKLKSFCVVHKDSPASTKPQKSVEGEKEEEGSFDHSEKGGWKTMPFIIGELPISLL